MSAWGPDDSLCALPSPYDISSAVTRALRLDSFHGTELTVPASECPINSLMAYDEWNTSKALDPALCAVSHTCGYVGGYVGGYVDDYTLESIKIDMAVRRMEANDAEFLPPQSRGDIDQLDEFCKYIDEEEEELLLPPTPPSVFRDRHRAYSISVTDPASSERATRRRTQKRRRTEEYDSSPEVSPERCSPPAQVTNEHPAPQRYKWSVSLENSNLWKKFDEVGTEMVITKNGRRMFPVISVRVKGLESDSVYSITLDILPSDNKRYKFMGTEWVPMGRAEKKPVYREYSHPDSPNLGSTWMEKPISFKMVKLTNNSNTCYGEQVILNSMQKYQPFITITSEQDGATQSYSFPQTQFIAVTAYQNNKITQLKVDNNPYARAFREGNTSEVGDVSGGHNQQKRASTSSAGSPESTPKRVRRAKMANRRPTRSTVATCEWATDGHVNCTSATSIESGFESGEGCSSEFYMPEEQLVVVDDPGLLPLPDTVYGCPTLGYWADATLYNPALITPPPMLDSSSSFSEPYLQESYRVAMETAQYSPSPVKGIHLYSDIETSFDDTLVLDVVFCADDDDVFM